MEVDLTGFLERGRGGEYRAVKNLIGALRARGDTVERVTDAKDDRGEDAILRINGTSVTVQIVTVPVDSALWRNLALNGEASVKITLDEAVQLIRDALVHKKGKATGTILILHAAHIGAVIGPKLVETYFAAYGDVEEEFGVREAWLVGPTVRSTIRLKS
jgi:hypothetical protein